MTERPIIFSTPMVRAILSGAKTQTRRVVKPQPEGCVTGAAFTNSRPDVHGSICEIPPFWQWVVEDDGAACFRCPYGVPGDRLWVREAWGFTARVTTDSHERWMREHDGTYLIYRATSGAEQAAPWHPSIHMPRWASRITLEVTAVRVERLQDIDHDDARSEGILNNATFYGKHNRYDGLKGDGFLSPREAFAHLWDSINADRGYGWEANPWVWAITFKRVPLIVESGRANDRSAAE